MSLSRLKKPVWLLSLPLLLFLPAACQTTASVGTSSTTMCAVFKPIYWSKDDTRETQEQVVEHNKVWSTLCKDKKNGS